MMEKNMAANAAEQAHRAMAMKVLDQVADQRDAATRHLDEAKTMAAQLKKRFQQPSVQDQLPPGWTAHFDATRKRDYFHHAATKTSTWEKPVLEAPTRTGAAQPDQPEAAAAAARSETEAA